MRTVFIKNGSLKLPFLVLHKVTNNRKSLEWTDISIASLDDLLRMNQTTNRFELTFDDGNKSDIEAVLPLLCKYKQTAFFFIVTDYVGAEEYMDWKDIKALCALGMKIGSHSKSHKNLALLTAGEMESELKLSKEILEDNLGCEVTAFSIPFGESNSTLRQLAKKYYQHVFTSSPLERGEGFHGRISINANTNISDLFKRPLAIFMISKYAFYLFIKTFKILAGYENYKTLRKLFF